MSRITLRLLAALAVGVASLAAAAVPAQAENGCDDGFTVYVLDPLADAALVAVDLNADGSLCVTVRDDVAIAVDNSELAAILPIGIPSGWTSVTGDVTIGDVDITTGDILTADQRGNRNNNGAVNVCSQNTGNSCFSNNKLLQHVKVVVADDALADLL